MNLPGHNYAGPFNKLNNGPAGNALDAFSREHDYEYDDIGPRAYFEYTEGDEKLFQRAKRYKATGFADSITKYTTLGYFFAKKHTLRKHLDKHRNDPRYENTRRRKHRILDVQVYGPDLPNNVPRVSKRTNSALSRVSGKNKRRKFRSSKIYLRTMAGRTRGYSSKRRYPWRRRRYFRRRVRPRLYRRRRYYRRGMNKFSFRRFQYYLARAGGQKQYSRQESKHMDITAYTYKMAYHNFPVMYSPYVMDLMRGSFTLSGGGEGDNYRYHVLNCRQWLTGQNNSNVNTEVTVYYCYPKQLIPKDSNLGWDFWSNLDTLEGNIRWASYFYGVCANELGDFAQDSWENDPTRYRMWNKYIKVYGKRKWLLKPGDCFRTGMFRKKTYVLDTTYTPVHNVLALKGISRFMFVTIRGMPVHDDTNHTLVNTGWASCDFIYNERYTCTFTGSAQDDFARSTASLATVTDADVFNDAVKQEMEE